MDAQARSISWRGTPFNLSGTVVKVGDPAPDCELVANDLSLVRLSSYQGKIRIISAVPSLDTPTCDMETRKFNDMAANMHADTVILTVSMDLPFAQKRWCGAAGIDKVITLSDHLKGEFGLAYGVLIESAGCWPGPCSWSTGRAWSGTWRSSAKWPGNRITTPY